MKKISVVLLCIQSLLIQAQTIYVKDKSSLRALPDVQVNNQKTNEAGQVELSSIAVNRLNPLYRFSLDGYFSDSLSADELKASNYTVLLTESSHQWQGIVVSASKFEEKTTDIAQQLTVIDQKQMQFANQPTTAELLQQSGRAFVQKSQMGGGSVVMRGFEANKVLMVIDGVRMNNAIYRGGHLQNVISVDNNMLKRTELLFGPGSVIYGSDALGGVIHFYTKDPQVSRSDKPFVQGMGFTRYGSALQEKTVHADFNIGLKKFAFLSSVSYSDFGDMRIGKTGTKGYESWGRKSFTVQRFDNKDSMVLNSDSFRQVPTAYKQWDIMQKILFKPNRQFSHLINLQHSNTTDIPRYDRLSELNSAGRPKQAEWYYGPQTRTLAAYKLSIDKKHVFFEKAGVIASYQDIKESRHNRGFGSSNRSHRAEHVKIMAINADFEKEIGPKTELRYGLELNQNDVQSTAYRENITTGSTSALDSRYPDGGSVMRSLAAYATQNTYFSKHFILNTGIRFTNIYLKSVFQDKTFFPFLGNHITQRNQNTSGHLGLVYLGKSDLKIAGGMASGFRAPNVDDVAKVFESTGGRVIIPNANLKPEQTLTLDLTINKTFFKKLSVELNGYHTALSNALTLGRAQLNGLDSLVFDGKTSAVYSSMNAQNAYIRGAYAGVNYDITKKISLNGHINYTYGRILTDSTDMPLDHISPVFGRIGIIYKHKNWKAEFFTLFNGAKKSADYNLSGEDNQLYSADPINGFNPAWQTLNVRGFYQFNSMFQLQVALENILDQHYRTFSSGTSAAGRNLMLTLRANF